MWQPEAKKMAKYADVIWDAQCQVIVILELSHRDIYLPINWGKGKRRGWRREGKGVCIEKASGKGILEHTYISACKYSHLHCYVFFFVLFCTLFCIFLCSVLYIVLYCALLCVVHCSVLYS